MLMVVARQQEEWVEGWFLVVVGFELGPVF